MERKMTYKSAVEFVLNGYELPDDVREKLIALDAQLSKKAENKGDRKPTATQIANGEIAQKIADFLRENGYRTARALREQMPELAGETPQKVAGILARGEKLGLLIAEKNEKGKVMGWSVRE